MKDEGKEARTLFLPFYLFTFLPLKIMPNDKKAYAQREKAYMQGKLFPQIKVGMTKVNLTPTVVKDERGIPHTEPNAPVYIYDTSGPYSDPNYQVDLKKGLPRMREQWILDRNDTEQLAEVTSEYGKLRLADHSLDHLRFEHIQLLSLIHI